MTKMNITEDALKVCDKDRLFNLLTIEGLPISQALAVHLCDELKWRPCDAARLLEISQIAITDSRRKGRKKLNTA